MERHLNFRHSAPAIASRPGEGAGLGILVHTLGTFFYAYVYPS